MATGRERGLFLASSPRQDPPLCRCRGLKSPARALRVAELRDIFSRCMTGDWALDPVSIGLLWESLQEDRPNSILEFGSGKSTLMLARYAQSRRPERVTVVSLEQGMTAGAATERLLEESGLGGMVTVLTVPIDDSGFYQAAPDEVAVALGGSQPEWLLIDGPRGPAGCRVDTLLRFGALCSPASHWYLDDAFRDGEMEALKRWNRTPGLRVDGIYPVGQGLATGRIVAPASV